MATLIEIRKEQLDFIVKLLANATKIHKGKGLSEDLARLAKDTLNLDELAHNFKRAQNTRGADGIVHLHIDKLPAPEPVPPSEEGYDLFSDKLGKREVEQMIRRLQRLPVRREDGGKDGDAFGRLLDYFKMTNPVKKNKD